MSLRTGLILVGILLVFLVSKTLGYEAVRVHGAAMAPAIKDGQYVLAAKWPYGYNRYSIPRHLPVLPVQKPGVVPNRGDIVVFVHPLKRSGIHVSRVIGLPGETIQIKSGLVILEEQQLPSESVALPNDMDLSPRPERAFVEILPNGKSHMILDIEVGSEVDNTDAIKIPQGHVFVMGDNRDNSKDSRAQEHGVVPLEAVFGRVDHFLYTL
ncbi:MAG: signal peptidase I [Pseudomonadota bacterium]